MVSMQGEYDALVPRWNKDGQVRVEPLHAIYSKRCAQVIERQIAEGDLKISNLLAHLDVTYLDESAMRPYDPELRSFYNLNTKEEWENLINEGGGRAF